MKNNIAWYMGEQYKILDIVQPNEIIYVLDKDGQQKIVKETNIKKTRFDIGNRVWYFHDGKPRRFQITNISLGYRGNDDDIPYYYYSMKELDPYNKGEHHGTTDNNTFETKQGAIEWDKTGRNIEIG